MGPGRQLAAQQRPHAAAGQVEDLEGRPARGRQLEADLGGGVERVRRRRGQAHADVARRGAVVHHAHRRLPVQAFAVVHDQGSGLDHHQGVGREVQVLVLPRGDRRALEDRQRGDARVDDLHQPVVIGRVDDPVADLESPQDAGVGQRGHVGGRAGGRQVDELQRRVLVHDGEVAGDRQGSDPPEGPEDHRPRADRRQGVGQVEDLERAAARGARRDQAAAVDGQF